MHIPYPLQSIPMVVFFKMEFWVGSSSFASKSGLLNKKWAFIQKTLKNGWSGVVLQIC